MLNENNFETNDVVCVLVTPAQKELLQLITPHEAEDIYQSLKKVHYLGTYCIDNDMADLFASGSVHDLLDAIQKIAFETTIKELNHP